MVLQPCPIVILLLSMLAIPLCSAFCNPACATNFQCVGGNCVCISGFYGNSCTDKCEDSGAGQCKNGGTCNNNSPRTCDCTSDYTGSLCEQQQETTTQYSAAYRVPFMFVTLLVILFNLISRTIY